ncbi:MAG: DUF2232 domain-containing protein [Gemmatimonadales bacterium]
MTDTAAPLDAGRRPAFGTAFVMAAFLYVAPPLFLLTPLCLLLLFSRPHTGREWFWILTSAGAAAYSVLLAARSTAPDATLVSAFALFCSASFLLYTHVIKAADPVVRGLAALITAAGAIILWTSRTGLEIGTLDALVEANLRATIPILLKDAPAAQISAANAAVPVFVRIIPGLVMFQALAGLGLAWRWYHRIAAAPASPASGPFRAFRFPDPLIWGAIFTLGLSLVPMADGLSRVVHNALVIWVGLYLTRGLAVVWAATHRWSLPGRLLLFGFSFLALPVAFGTVVTLGLADVWVDFRRRAALNSGGTESDGSHST